MIHRILDFVFVLLLVWSFMILGMWTIDSVIVPLELPWVANDVIGAIVKVGLSVAMVAFWLWLWREIIKRMFWRITRRTGTS